MTRTYKRIRLNKKEQEFTAIILHKVAKRIEVKADAVGYDIDQDQDWINAHTILAEYEFENKSLVHKRRLSVYNALERISSKVGYNFWGGVVYYIEHTAFEI